MATARQIIERALRLLKVIAANESAAAADASTGLIALNDMLDSWSIDKYYVLTTVDESFPLISGQATYTIGTGGNFNTAVPIYMLEASYISFQTVDFPLRSITQDEYTSISYKASGGIPQVFYFDRGVTLANVSFFPVPQALMTLTLSTIKPMASFVDLDTTYNLAPGYKEALIYSLAESLAPEFETDVPKAVAVQAVKRRKSLKRSNVVVPTMDIGFIPANTGRVPLMYP